jgi:hypothetical protein
MLVAGASVGFSFSVDIVRSWAKIRALPPFWAPSRLRAFTDRLSLILWREYGNSTRTTAFAS